MKRVEIVCRGLTPLLVHRFNEETEQNSSTRKTLVQRIDPRQEATKNAYIAPDGKFYINAFSITGSLAAAGSNHKMKGSRKSLKYIIPSAVMTETDTITILDNELKPSINFEVDARPVVIPATKGRVMRYRPRWNSWKLSFVIIIDETLIEIDTIHQLLNEAGNSQGIGDFRPNKFGPFGRFVVESWKVLE